MLETLISPDPYDVLCSEPSASADSFDTANYSRTEFLDAADIAAEYLRSEGFKAGDVLYSWLPDGAAWMQFLLACMRLGVLLVPISDRTRQEEALHILRTSRAKGVIVATRTEDANYAATAKAIAEEAPFLSHIIEIDISAGFFRGPDKTRPISRSERAQTIRVQAPSSARQSISEIRSLRPAAPASDSRFEQSK